MPERNAKGPLAGIRIVEMVGIGPAPLAAMLLSDLGADCIRIDRPRKSDAGVERPFEFDLAARGRRSVAVDLKDPEGLACALELVGRADALIEGFRPGTMERLGAGPDVCLAHNPSLVYGRLTGWGQQGPLARTAGHDLNYIGLTGTLDAIGRKGSAPTPPLNFLGDYAGGSMLMALGIVSAILNAGRSGEGQVVDAAMIDGASLLATALTGFRAAGMHDRPRGENLLDSGAPHYDVYACSDGRYVSVAPIEAKFRRILLERLGFDVASFPDVGDPAQWDEAKKMLAGCFRQRTRDEWAAIFADCDACVAPLLTLEEAPDHPHNRARGSHVAIAGVIQPVPAPRFSATPAPTPTPPESRGASSRAVLLDWGFEESHVDRLCTNGVVGVQSGM